MESRSNPHVSDDDHCGDGETNDGVDPMKSSPQDREAGNNDTGRDRRIGHHVQERPADVQITLAARHEHQCGRGVDRNTHEST